MRAVWGLLRRLGRRLRDFVVTVFDGPPPDSVTRKNLDRLEEGLEGNWSCEPMTPPQVRAFGVPDAPRPPSFDTF